MSNNKNEIRIEQLTLHLNEMPGSVEPGLVDFLDQNGEWIDAPRGTHIIHKGAPAGDIYLAISGRLQVIAGEGEAKRIVGDIPSGELIGEMSYFTGEPRSADVYAMRDSVLLKLQKPVFDELIARHPALMNAIVRQLINRLRKSVDTEKISCELKTIAVIPANKEIPVTDVAHQITSILKDHSTAMCLDGSQAIKENKHTYTRLNPLLDKQEHENAYVLYVADHAPNKWSHICVDRSDIVLIIADASGRPDTGLAETILKSDANTITEPPRVLVLLHRDSSIVPGITSQWLGQIKAQHHFHIRKNNSNDIDRLTRFLSDRTVGLTLSGGGARGFAHIGVVRAFREAGIPIDVVGGSSMGACIGAMTALEYDEQTMVRLCMETFIHPRPFSQYTLPLISLLRHGVFDKSASNTYGEGDIEDCWIKYFCMASNLSNAQELVLSNGSLQQAVLASMAMPGTVAPRIHSEGLLVDGGMLNNLPADIMQQHAHVVVSIDATTERKIQASIKEFPSPWSILLNKLLRREQHMDIPGIMDIMMRSALLASAQHEKRVKECSHLYLRLPVGDYKLMDMNKISEIVEAGYRYTHTMLETNGEKLAVTH
jgi:predicted acylesterase/phospholipase RssA